MKKNYPKISSCFKPGLLLLVFLFFSTSNFAQDNLNITNSYTINGFERYDNVTLTSNSSILTVNGTLVIDGDLIMNGNTSQLIMGANARLIVFGNFQASNKVELSISSYLIIQGDFKKGGSSNQGDLNVESGNIYIYGEVENWGDEFTTCGDYTGNTNEINNQDCEYGTEDDFEENENQFPSDLLEQLNCYDLKVSDQRIFLGNNAIFTASDARLENVDSYQWQTKNEGGKWTNIDEENQFELEIFSPQLEDSGKQYRVIVRGNSSDCKISISRGAMLEVNPIPQIENESPEIVCAGETIQFSVEEKDDYEYAWYRRDGGGNFFPINENGSYSGTNTAIITVASKSWMDNQDFRVEITNSQGNKTFSNIVNFQVNQTPGGIWSSPIDAVVCEGANSNFSVNSSGESIQWQVSLDEGENWNDLQNNDNYNNVSGSNLKIIEAPIIFNDNLYRAKIYNENCAIYSDPALLRVDPDPITRQPHDAFVAFGENAMMEAEVTGNNLTYQWQTYSSNWYDINNDENYSGTKTKQLELITVGYWPVDGSRYRLLVTNENGCVSISEVAFLNVVQNQCENQITWTGIENTNWNNIANWNCNTLPTVETDVLIPEDLNSGNYPEISSGVNAYTKNLVIENNASVEVNNNWLRIAGNLTNNGILNTVNGSISFQGTEAQSIPNNAFENNRIENLRINNVFGVASQSTIEITGTLNVENGDFNTGNKLSLVSNEIQTALIDGSGNGEIIGLVTMQRYLDNTFGYKYFSSPFQNSVVNDFDPYLNFVDPATGFPHFYRYNENRRVDSLNLDATGWEVYTDAGNSLDIAKGYALNFGTSTTPETIEITGTVTNGPIPTQELLNHHRAYTKGFHLVGNPYPSPIDWEAESGWTRNNIDNSIYFFTASETNQYTGTYTAYVNDISTAEPLADSRSSNIIPSMQGFFIKVSDSDTEDVVSGSFGMNNKVRVNNFEQNFFRSQVADLKSLIRLEAGYDASTRDALVIYFSPYATQNFEKEMDAHKLMNTDPAVPNFYNITESNKELAINAIDYPQNRGYIKIPLGIKSDQGGKMMINLASVKNLSPSLKIYLIDHEKGIGQNLRKNAEYFFNIKSGKQNSRFELMFSEEEITNPAIAFNEPFDVKVQDGDVVISLNLEEHQKGILRASTITGQIIQIKEASGKEKVIFDGITSDGVYIINLQRGKAEYAKKVLIKK
ncbi:hypothetical protein [Salegentibacter sp. 24]|uniref:hypothetical protein n=1 Tax=Salegentibacter sp. 24 TaxID=2183986 RepID=UPI00105D77D5|nr:hypothetical protein [Salegentibacter sp. 24]